MTHASAVVATAPFLTEAGLVKLNESVADGFWPPGTLTPHQTHRRIQKFLVDDYRFGTTLDVYGFLAALNNARSQTLLG